MQQDWLLVNFSLSVREGTQSSASPAPLRALLAPAAAFSRNGDIWAVPHHHSPNAEPSRGGAWRYSQVSQSKASKCREREEQKKAV